MQTYKFKLIRKHYQTRIFVESKIRETYCFWIDFEVPEKYLKNGSLDYLWDDDVDNTGYFECYQWDNTTRLRIFTRFGNKDCDHDEYRYYNEELVIDRWYQFMFVKNKLGEGQWHILYDAAGDPY